MQEFLKDLEIVDVKEPIPIDATTRGNHQIYKTRYTVEWEVGKYVYVIIEYSKMGIHHITIEDNYDGVRNLTAMNMAVLALVFAEKEEYPLLLFHNSLLEDKDGILYISTGSEFLY